MFGVIGISGVISWLQGNGCMLCDREISSALFFCFVVFVEAGLEKFRLRLAGKDFGLTMFGSEKAQPVRNVKEQTPERHQRGFNFE